MMDIQDFEKLEFLRSQIASTEGLKIEMGIRDIGMSHYIFTLNYNHLKKSLELFDSKDGSKLWAIKNRDKLDLFQKEVIRLFHNYLASVKSLVEHTRTIVREVHGNNEFSKESKIKIKAMFDNSPLSHFMQDLRNYILHKGIPNTFARMTPKESMKSEVTSSIMLDLSSLRSWDGWKAKSKEYLYYTKDDISLYEIIVAYGSLVNDFYNWFLNRQKELFKEQFERTQKLKDEYNKIILKYKLSDE